MKIGNASICWLESNSVQISLTSPRQDSVLEIKLKDHLQLRNQIERGLTFQTVPTATSSSPYKIVVKEAQKNLSKIFELDQI